MRREDEYRQLATSVRKRAGDEENALMRAQWEIFGGYLCASSRSIGKELSADEDR
jgi:hypothetical protein